MINTTLCYIEKNHKYLMLHRDKKENDLNAAKWIGVGGKFEEGETAEECLVREVYEETGLTLSAYTYVGMIKFLSDIYEDEDMYLFKGTDFTGEVKADCPEGTLKWIDADKVLDLPTWEGDKHFLKPLLEGKTNLNMTVRYEGDKLAELKDDTEAVVIDTSAILSSPHGFSTRIGGVSDDVYKSLNLGMNRGDVKERVIENWRRFMEECGIGYRPFVCGKQVHGNNVHVATRADARWAYGPGELIEADGYVTREADLPLAIFTADCVPLLLEDDKNGVIGAIHCGWRSTVADIEGAAIAKMCSLGADTDTIKASIGPAIGRCCFEVGPEVIEAVNNLVGPKAIEAVNNLAGSKKADDHGTIVTEEADNLTGTNTYYTLKPNGRYMLDLKGIVALRLTQLGIREENIDFAGGCTMCNPKIYYSHRYSSGSRGSLASIIMRKN